MQKWLDDKDILMYSTHNEGKSAVAERFKRTLKSNNKKSYLGYLNKLVDEYNNTCHCSIGKKPVDADYSALTKEIETNPKSPKFKVGDRVRMTKSIKTFLANVTPKIY